MDIRVSSYWNSKILNHSPIILDNLRSTLESTSIVDSETASQGTELYDRPRHTGTHCFKILYDRLFRGYCDGLAKIMNMQVTKANP